MIDCPWICGEYIEANTGATVLAAEELAEAGDLTAFNALVVSSFAKLDQAAVALPAGLPEGDTDTHDVWVYKGVDWHKAAGLSLAGYPAF